MKLEFKIINNKGIVIDLDIDNNSFKEVCTQSGNLGWIHFGSVEEDLREEYNTEEYGEETNYTTQQVELARAVADFMRELDLSPIMGCLSDDQGGF